MRNNPLGRMGYKLDRWEGRLLFAGYNAYIYYLYSIT
jgi:hypothetical protein